MDHCASVGKALRMPELLASVLRWLGPLDWLSCTAVCSWWSIALLDCDTTKPLEGDAPAAGATSLWRDFAEATMSYEHNPSQRGSSHDGGSGGRRASYRRNTYKTVCLDGNRTVLGPPLRVAGDGNVAIVMLKQVAEASLARSRKPRALVKFLLHWASFGTIVPTAAGDARRARVTICEDFIRFVYPRNFGRPGAINSRDVVTPTVGSAAHRAARKASRRQSKVLPSAHVATATVNDGLRMFTRLFVLCRRCRSPRTTLCASDHRRVLDNGRGQVLSGFGENLILSVECQEERCGLTSEVHVNRKSSPHWLTKFTEYVLHRSWEVRRPLALAMLQRREVVECDGTDHRKRTNANELEYRDINTLEADHGAEWFSDTSPEAVQRRQEEARAESLGLDALATRNISPTADET